MPAGFPGAGAGRSQKRKESVITMQHTLFISSREYDYNSIRKVAAVNSYLGNIRIHDAEGGYLLSFSGCPQGEEAAMREFQQYLIDLTHNIWSH